MNEIAYIIYNYYYEKEEIDFNSIKEITNNVIIVYDENFTSFKRALFEADRLGFNIGICCNNKKFLSDIRGFNINLGVWISKDTPPEDIKYLYDNFKSNFIVGYITSDSNLSPRWGHMGDIEYYNDILGLPYDTVCINTDFKKIYDENHLKPIPSNYKFF